MSCMCTFSHVTVSICLGKNVFAHTSLQRGGECQRVSFVKLLLLLYPKHEQYGEAAPNCGLPLCWHGSVVGRVHLCSGGVLYTLVLYSVTVLFHTVAFPRNQLNIIYNTRSLSDGLAKCSIITVTIHTTRAGSTKLHHVA